jgi:diguanylate cyclase
MGVPVNDHERALAEVADFSSKGFADPDDALAALLDVVQKIIKFQTVLISEISTAKAQLRVHAVKNADPALTVPLGLQIPLSDSPCHHVASAGEPFTAADMHADLELAMLPAAKDMGATSYIGVPIVLADGSFFGTLVGLDIASKESPKELVQWLEILARLAALELQRQDARQLV